MKKLMIAALVAAVAGVTFADCETASCVYAYRIKLAGKTVKSKALSAASSCDTAACWAKKASLRIAGYFWDAGTAEDDCDCTCEENSLLGGAQEEKDIANKVFWDETKTEVVFDEAKIQAEILRNSGAKDKAQILITLDDLNLAGFGVFNPQTGRLKRAHGFFAGKLPVTQCTTMNAETCELEGTDPNVFAPCALDTAIPSTFSIAYGRWNLAWKSEKVALIKAGNAPLSKGVLLPAAFTSAESSEGGDEPQP